MTIAEPRNAERLNAFMRPGDDIDPISVAQGILRVIGDLRFPADREQALAYVFDGYPYARFSGGPMMAAEYPKPCTNDEYAAAMQRVEKQLPRFIARYGVLVAQLHVDAPGAEETAKRAWAFLESIPEASVRAVALANMLTHRVFVTSEIAPTHPPFAEEADDERRHRALWTHRDILKRIVGALAQDGTPALVSEGAVVFDLVAAIEDPYERAVVMGWALHQYCPSASSSTAPGLSGIINAILGVP